MADGGFTHEYSAPSAGPPSWYIYEFMPEDAYAVPPRSPAARADGRSDYSDGPRSASTRNASPSSIVRSASRVRPRS